MRVRPAAAAAVAMAVVPGGLVGWAGPAAAQPQAAAASCDTSDSVVEYKANMEYAEAGAVIDASNVVGTTSLLYSARCRWAQAAVSLDEPLADGKHAWASLYDWTYSEVAQCSVNVGSQGCATSWSNDRGIQEKAMAFYSGTMCGNCGYTWIGETPFY